MNKIIVIIAVALALYGAFWFGKRSAIAPEGPIGAPNGFVEPATTTPATTTQKVAPRPTASKTTTGTSAGTPVMTKSGAYLISYTDRGFVPAKLEIKAGKSVHFVNNSNKAMSLTTTDPDSQVHREFNQENSVGRGASFDFTFLTAGVWGYTNRNNKGDTGTIIVK